MQNATEKKDVYSRITAQIVEHLEKGVRPWIRPWNAEHAAGRITRPLRHNGQPYSGINILSLWMSALAQNFAAPIWMTYRQASELNAHVKKGEKGSLVVYANVITRTERDDKTGQDVEREIPYMKGYSVFNVEQIEGLPEIYYAKAVPTLDPVALVEHAEKFFANLGATIKHGGTRAYYAQELDYVQMPPFEAFRDPESYYSTLAHELAHNAASRIMPRWMTKALRTDVYPTRLVGIITATPGTRAEHRRADTVRVSSPGRRLVPMLSL
jgi:antirestriction protein ArdC